jgi:inner membrane protein
LNSILWTANVDADSSYFIGYYSIFDTQDQISFNQLDKNRDDFKEIMKEELVQRLIKLCKGWYIIQKTEEGYAFNDLRFGMFSFAEETEEFVFRYNLIYVDGALNVTQRQPEIDNAKEMFAILWSRLKGN